MKATKKTITTSYEMDLGGEYHEVELEVTGTCYPYVPARGPTYSCGGEPPEPAYAEIDTVTADGPCSIWKDAFADKIEEELLEAAMEDERESDYGPDDD